MQVVDRLKERLGEYLLEKNSIAEKLHPLISRHDALEVVIQELESMIRQYDGSSGSRRIETMPLIKIEDRKPAPQKSSDDARISVQKLREDQQQTAGARSRFAQLGEAIVGDDTIATQIIAGIVSSITGEFTVRDVQERMPPPDVTETTVRNVIQKLINKGHVAAVPNTGLGRNNPTKFRFLQKQVA